VLAAQPALMRADTGFHSDQARRLFTVLALATSPFLPQHDGTALIKTHNVERVLANIDAKSRRSSC
jgi:hypothetical protein